MKTYEAFFMRLVINKNRVQFFTSWFRFRRFVSIRLLHHLRNSSVWAKNFVMKFRTRRHEIVWVYFIFHWRSTKIPDTHRVLCFVGTESNCKEDLRNVKFMTEVSLLEWSHHQTRVQKMTFCVRFRRSTGLKLHPFHCVLSFKWRSYSFTQNMTASPLKTTGSVRKLVYYLEQQGTLLTRRKETIMYKKTFFLAKDKFLFSFR